MLYILTCRVSGKYKRAMVETWDCEVVKATPAFKWAIGEQYHSIEAWCWEHGWEIALTERDPFPSLAGLPSDSEIAHRTSP